MRLITGDDEALFQAVTVATKLGKAATVLDRLTAKYEDDWDPAGTGFPCALAMLAVLQASGTEFEKHAGYHSTIEILDEVIDDAPDHWLARYCRIRLRSLIPPTYGLYQDYLTDEQAKATDDVDDLVRRQAAAGRQPYFASTFLIGAQLRLQHGDDAGAAAHVERARAAAHGPVPFPAIGAILAEPFLAVHQAVAPAQRDTVAALMTELFADQPAVRTRLGAPAGTPSGAAG